MEAKKYDLIKETAEMVALLKSKGMTNADVAKSAQTSLKSKGYKIMKPVTEYQEV